MVRAHGLTATVEAFWKKAVELLLFDPYSHGSGLRFAKGRRASLVSKAVWQSNFSHTWFNVKLV